MKDPFNGTAVAILGKPPKHSPKERLRTTTFELSNERRRLKGIKCTFDSIRIDTIGYAEKSSEDAQPTKGAHSNHMPRDAECTLPEQKQVSVPRRSAHHWSQKSPKRESRERQKWVHAQQFKTGQRQMERAPRATVQPEEHSRPHHS